MEVLEEFLVIDIPFLSVVVELTLFMKLFLIKTKIKIILLYT
jgi:hypothetical protein